MTASIAGSTSSCLKAFNLFVRQAKGTPKSISAKLGLDASPWEDELGRLRMWAANIGAHRTGQSSLDFRLRDSSHIQNQIVKLLADLLQRVEEAAEILAEDEEETKGSDSDELSDGEDSTTELQELRESAATMIDCLFQISMLVRKPAKHDMMLGSNRAEVAAFEPFDYSHVREKFPNADDTIVKRLGLALTCRRNYLKYRERHAMKLKQGMSRVASGFQDGQTRVEGTVSLLSDTVATDAKETNIHFVDGASDSGVSQTSYAMTLLGGGDITIPRPPKDSHDGKPFECPYCHLIMTINGTRSWNRHVFHDLQPYICVAPMCTTPEKMYATRHEWVHHLETAHPMDHPETKKEEKDHPDLMDCPLCEKKLFGQKLYDRHLARHLQELALFVLPRDDDDSDNEAEKEESSDQLDVDSSDTNSTNNDEADPVSKLLDELTQSISFRWKTFKAMKHVPQATQGDFGQLSLKLKREWDLLCNIDVHDDNTLLKRKNRLLQATFNLRKRIHFFQDPLSEHRVQAEDNPSRDEDLKSQFDGSGEEPADFEDLLRSRESTPDHEMIALKRTSRERVWKQEPNEDYEKFFDRPARDYDPNISPTMTPPHDEGDYYYERRNKIIETESDDEGDFHYYERRTKTIETESDDSGSTSPTHNQGQAVDKPTTEDFHPEKQHDYPHSDQLEELGEDLEGSRVGPRRHSELYERSLGARVARQDKPVHENYQTFFAPHEIINRPSGQVDASRQDPNADLDLGGEKLDDETVPKLVLERYGDNVKFHLDKFEKEIEHADKEIQQSGRAPHTTEEDARLL